MIARCPKKVMQMQVEAYNRACGDLGLPEGRVEPGKGHWKFVTRWAVADCDLTVLIATSPRAVDQAVKHARRNLRGEMRRMIQHVEGRR